MRRFALAVVAWTAGCAGPSPISADWMTQIYGPHAQVAVLDSSNVQESSGVVAGRLNADLLWTHNDSGASGPRVWAMRLNASDLAAGTAHDLGYVQLTGATNTDWEDLAAGPNGYIYVFDGGDNPPCGREGKRIHRFVEPVIDTSGSPVALNRPFESIRFEYPDSSDPDTPADSNSERFDAECLMVHPITGDIFIVTKRNDDNTGVARVYKLAADRLTWDGASMHVLQFVTDLTSELGVTANITSTVTGGDIDPDGRRVLIRRYGYAFEFTAPAGAPIEAAFDQSPTQLAMGGEVQGEGICYSRDGGDIYSTSEVVSVNGIPIGPSRCPIFITPWQLANVRATGITPVGATVRWDTKPPADSRVDYGTSTGYGQHVAAGEAVSSHALPLAGLTLSTRYYYRITSSGLIWPPDGAAAAWQFTTRATVAPDFDGDGDVDQEDFGHFQRCLSGVSVPQAAPECLNTRLDEDADVDAADFQYLHFCFSGPNIPADPQCGPPS